MARKIILTVLCLWGLWCIGSEQWPMVTVETIALRDACAAMPRLGGHKVCAIDPRVNYWSGLPTVPSVTRGSVVDSAIAAGCDMILLTPFENLRNANLKTTRGDERISPVLVKKANQIYVFKVNR